MQRPFLTMALTLACGCFLFSSANAALTFMADSKIVAENTSTVDISIRVTGLPSDDLQFYSLSVDLIPSAGAAAASWETEPVLTGLTARESNPDYILNDKGVTTTGASPKPVVRNSATNLALQDGVSIPQVVGPGGAIGNSPETPGVGGRLVANLRFNIAGAGIQAGDLYQIAITALPNSVQPFAASGTIGTPSDFSFVGGAATDVELFTLPAPGSYTGTDLTDTAFVAGFVSATPEPSSLLLLTSAGLGILIRRRRS